MNNNGWFRACNFGDCLEVAHDGDRVWIRSSQAPHDQARGSVAEWRRFVADVKAGKFDHIAEEGA